MPRSAIIAMFWKDRALVRELRSARDYREAIQIASAMTGIPETTIREQSRLKLISILSQKESVKQKMSWLYARSPILATGVAFMAAQDLRYSDYSDAQRQAVSVINYYLASGNSNGTRTANRLDSGAYDIALERILLSISERSSAPLVQSIDIWISRKGLRKFDSFLKALILEAPDF